MKRILFLTICLVAVGLYFRTALYEALEGTPPTITLHPEFPVGLGVQPKDFSMKLSDAGAGLRSVEVSLLQDDRSVVLKELSDLGGVPVLELEISLPGAAAGFQEGLVLLKIQALDNSLRRNKLNFESELLVDTRKPELAVLSQQHIANEGGAQFIIFRAADENLSDVFVRVGTYEFYGVPAAEVDANFEPHPEIYFSLFAIPFEFSAAEHALQVVARDVAGNETRRDLRFRIRPFRQRDVQPNLSDGFLSRIVPRLLPEYMRLSGVTLDPHNEDQFSEHFRIINEELRSLNDAVIEEVTAPISHRRDWGSVFQRPMAGTLSSNLGERRSYQHNGKFVSFSKHLGVDIASVVHDAVRAANDGKVVFNGSLGIYGDTVILDHGLGLYSLYSHLSSIAVSTGERVARGEEVGRSGETGLAGGDHLHFELRIGTLPVNPVEWWDAGWLRDQVDGKIASVLDQLQEQ